MTWTRLDDAWTDLPALAGLSLAARWHYLCLIQFCSRSGLFEGVMRVVDTLRCSDVDKPKEAMNELHRAGLIVRTDEPNKLRLVHIDDHVPPASVRDKTSRDRERQERSRRHSAGDHSQCYRERCEFGTLDEPKPQRKRSFVPVDESPVSSHVMSHVTPGQDRTGQDGHLQGEALETRIDTTTGEVFEPGDPWYGTTTRKTA